MDPSLLLSAGSLALGGIGSTLGSLFNKSSVDATNRANLELAKYQNNWNLEQWHRQNEYNSPSAQMQRLREAKINPNLAISNGQLSNVSASSPSAAPMSIQPYIGYSQDFNNIFANLMEGAQFAYKLKESKLQNKLSESQVEFVKADTAFRFAQEIAEFERATGLKLDNSMKRVQANYLGEQLRLGLEQQRTDIADKKSQIDLRNLTGLYTQQQTRNLIEELNNLRKTGRLTDEYIRKEKFDNKLRSLGINPNDSIVHRIIGRCLTEPNYLAQIKNNFTDFVNQSLSTFGGFDLSSLFGKKKTKDVPSWKANGFDTPEEWDSYVYRQRRAHRDSADIKAAYDFSADNDW